MTRLEDALTRALDHEAGLVAGRADAERRIAAYGWEDRELPPADEMFQLRVRLSGEVPGE